MKKHTRNCIKTYKIKPTKKQLKTIKHYWRLLELLEDMFCIRLNRLEKDMEKDTGIKGIEFFRNDGEYVGVGNWQRTMKLIQEDKLCGIKNE